MGIQYPQLEEFYKYLSYFEGLQYELMLFLIGVLVGMIIMWLICFVLFTKG